MDAIPAEDQPPGPGMVPVSDEEALEAVAAENPLGSPVAVGAAFYYALTGDGGPHLDFLRDIVTAESLASWGDFSWARDLLSGKAMMSRAEEPAPGLAYVRFGPGVPQNLVAVGNQVVEACTFATLAYRLEAGCWQVHGLGERLPAEELPAWIS